MKEKKRLKTIKRIQDLSITLDCNLFEVIPVNVMKQLSPNFNRPSIGFQYEPSTDLLTSIETKFVNK